MRIVVSGMLAGVPRHGGATWAVLQYVLGLDRLGHDVVVVESVPSLDPAITRYFDEVTSAFGLEHRAALVATDSSLTYGMTRRAVVDAARSADLLLDISGSLRDEDLYAAVATRVYVDLDPCFTQLWHDQGFDVGLQGHTHHVTVGLAIGSDGCTVPSCGHAWLTTLPPVVLDEWPAGNGIVHDALTTVANWRSYGAVAHEGRVYGQKAHSLRRFIDLPCRVNRSLVLAVSLEGEETDADAVERHGWKVVSPRRVAGDPGAYRDFVRGSRAEFGLAKSGYVDSRCGWFSDRSACYLAAGRPVIAQETGFSRYLQTGSGLLSFEDVDGAAGAIESVDGDYGAHRRAARELAEDLFDSNKVLRRLLACL